MTHLGARAAALVDGELGHEARERALAHLAICQDCRTEVQAQRALKRELLGLQAPNPPTPLHLRLLALPAQPEPAVERCEPGMPRTRYVTFGVAASVVGLLGGAFVLGGASHDGPDVRPPVDRYTMQHAVTVGDMPFGPPQLGGVETVRYVRP
jgi:anti-sigma factor RsiW